MRHVRSHEHITPRYSVDGKVIGTLLGLPSGELKAIEAGYPTNVKWCCYQIVSRGRLAWPDLYFFTGVKNRSLATRD